MASIEASLGEGYPERTIKIVVPFPAGGPTDVAARLVAQSLSPRLGHSVIVENQAGAGGRIGAKAVATAVPDGYTLLLGGTNVNAITGAIYKNLGFDPIKSFAPVAMIYTDSLALAVSPRVPADTCQELVKYAKDNPGKLKYGAPPGIYTHFAGEFFKNKTATDILFVPYKGGAPVVTVVLGGHIDMVFNNNCVTALQRAETEGACRHQPKPLARVAGHADHAGSGNIRLPVGGHIRLARSGRHFNDDHWTTQQRCKRRTPGSRGPR